MTSVFSSREVDVPDGGDDDGDVDDVSSGGNARFGLLGGLVDPMSGRRKREANRLR